MSLMSLFNLHLRKKATLNRSSPSVQKICCSVTGKVKGLELMMSRSESRFDYSLPHDLKREVEILNLLHSQLKEIRWLSRALWEEKNKFYLGFNIHASWLQSDFFCNELCNISKNFNNKEIPILQICEKRLGNFSQTLAENMNELRKKNIIFALNNYDHESSSINYLEEGAFAFLKMSPKLSQIQLDNLTFQKTLTGISSFITPLNITLISEGVNSVQQRQLLRKHKITLMQGKIF